MTAQQLIRHETENKGQYNQVAHSRKLLTGLYPKVRIKISIPGCWGHSGRIQLDMMESAEKTASGQHKKYNCTLTVPDGQYQSKKHFHSAGWGIIDAESGQKKLNVKPLILIYGYGYNGDYRSVTKRFYLFGQNEDGSYFLHMIRPIAGESLQDARMWMWGLHGNETIAARQGDLAFIPKKRMSGIHYPDRKIRIGNHEIWTEKITQTAHKIYVKNPVALHDEHRTQVLEGTFEIRLAKVWGGGSAD